MNTSLFNKCLSALKTPRSPKITSFLAQGSNPTAKKLEEIMESTFGIQPGMFFVTSEQINSAVEIDGNPSIEERSGHAAIQEMIPTLRGVSRNEALAHVCLDISVRMATELLKDGPHETSLPHLYLISLGLTSGRVASGAQLNAVAQKASYMANFFKLRQA